MKKISALLLLILASAFLCKGQERLEQALERYDYRRALEIIDSLAAEIGTDSTAMAGNREEVIDLAIQKSLCLRKLYRAEEAAEALAGVLHLDQFNMELLGNLAESHMQAGNTMDAFRIYGILGQMQADNPYFNICQARILYREKKYGDCLSTCRTIIARDSIPEIISMAGDAYKNLGQADSALACYNQVLRMKPEHVATMSKKADVLLGMKQYPPVIEMSRTYLQKDPDNMTMLPIYGLALHLQGSYPLSAEVFEKQRDLGDDSYAVHYYIGLNFYMLNNWPHAIPELEKAYQIDSSDVTLVYQLAHAKSHISHAGAKELNAESERLYSKALDMLKPSPAMMHNIYGSMAMARHMSERFEDAIRYYELSYQYNPKNISALSSIGYCYEKLKNYRKALEYYERYMKVGKPGSSGYRFVEESIKYVKQELFMEE